MSTLNELALPCLDEDLRAAHVAGDVPLAVALQIQTVRLLTIVAAQAAAQPTKGKKR